MDPSLLNRPSKGHNISGMHANHCWKAARARKQLRQPDERARAEAFYAERKARLADIRGMR